MGRRREEPLIETMFHVLKAAPWWAGPGAAAGTFILFAFVVPFLVGEPPPGLPAFWKPLFWMLGCLFAGVTVLAWIAAEVWKFFNRRQLDSQTGLRSLRELSWREFEDLVCEAYRRRGYVAQVTGSSSGDGGVDILLTRSGEKTFVQCKQWRATSVGVPTVREMLGVVVSEGANKGVIVTSGRFTQEAVTFAENNPQIELVDGPTLEEMVLEVQTTPAASPRGSVTAPKAEGSPAGLSPLCPTCGAPMVVKTARRGPNSGSQFWSCASFPDCRGKRPIG